MLFPRPLPSLGFPSGRPGPGMEAARGQGGCPLGSLTHPQGLEHSRRSENTCRISMSHRIGVNLEDFFSIENFKDTVKKNTLL